MNRIFFSYFLESYFLSYGEFKMREIKHRVKILRPASRRGSRGALPLVGGVCWGVTAGKASHNASNARDVTAGKMGRNSSSNEHVLLYIIYTLPFYVKRFEL